MKDLLIGSTSQLAHYWPKKNTEIISSRDINFDYIKSKMWNRIFIAFSESRTFIKDAPFYDVNVTYTLKVIDEIKDNCNKLIYLSTNELWSRSSGHIGIQDKFNFNKELPYPCTKEITTRTLSNKRHYPNVIVLFPGSFNSPYRNQEGFLFSKIFRSIIEEKKIEVGNINFYRELTHPKFVVKEILSATENKIIGSGRVVFVRDFVKELYYHFGLNYEDFVEEKNNNFSGRNNVFYLNSKECLYSYQDLLDDTLRDLYDLKK